LSGAGKAEFEKPDHGMDFILESTNEAQPAMAGQEAQGNKGFLFPPWGVTLIGRDFVRLVSEHF